MRFVLLAALAVAFVAPVEAQVVSVSAKAGTLGPGLEISTRVGSNFNLRGGGHLFSYSRSDEFRDMEVAVRADSDVKLSSLGVFADYLPFRNILRLSAGVLLNNNSAATHLTPIEEYEVDGKVFSPERIGTMEAALGHGARMQPYLGVGLGNPMTGRFTLLLDVGVLYTDAPTVSMSGSGMIAPTASQAPDLEASMHSFRWYPVVAVGFGFSF
jgi:hypothetical protein